MMSVPHLSLVPNGDHPAHNEPQPSGRRKPKWLIRVNQGTLEHPVDQILAEGIVDTRAAATQYAKDTYSAVGPFLNPQDPTIVWATATPGIMHERQWIPAGGTVHARFDPTTGDLGAWTPGHEPANFT